MVSAKTNERSNERRALRAVMADRLRRITGTAMFYGLVGTAVRVGSNILLLPLALTHLSTAEMAAWWLFLSLGGISNLADFGFGPVITRVYSYLWAGADDFEAEGLRPAPIDGLPNFPRLAQLHATVSHLYSLLAIIVAPALALGGTYFLLRIMHLIADQRSAWIAWAVFVAMTIFNLKTSYWGMAVQGINKVRELQVANLLGGIVYLMVGGLLLVAGSKLLALAAAVAVRAFIFRIVCIVVFHRAIDKKTLKRAKSDRSMLARLWPNAWKLGVTSLGAYCITQGLILVASRFLSVETVASLGLTQQVGVFATSIAALWLQVKWPEITIFRTHNKLREMSALFAQRLLLTIATFALIAAAIILLGNQLLSFKAAHTRLLPLFPLTFYLAYLAFQMTYGTFAVLAMTENINPFYRISIIAGVATVIVSIAMTARWQLWGLLLAPLICETYSAWFVIRVGLGSQPLSVRELGIAAFRREQ